MSWFNSFKKNESALSNLSKKIFESAALCEEIVKPYLEERFKKDSKEFDRKYITTLCEFMYFFMHFTNRLAFHYLGKEKREKLQDELSPPTIHATIEALFGHWPQNLKNGIKEEFYQNLNNAEIEYSTCKEIFLTPEQDVSAFDKVQKGQKSIALVNMLIDNIAENISDSLIVPLDLHMQLVDAVLNILNKKEFNDLILAVAKDIK
jgi:hypothetical protein